MISEQRWNVPWCCSGKRCPMRNGWRIFVETMCAPFCRQSGQKPLVPGGETHLYKWWGNKGGASYFDVCLLWTLGTIKEPCLSISTGKISERSCVLQDRGKDMLLLNIHSTPRPRSLSQPQDSLLLTFIQTLSVLYPVYLLIGLLTAF